jgi:ribose transport system substrate-binding protein
LGELKKKPYIIGILLVSILLIIVIGLYEKFRPFIGGNGITSEAKEYSKHYVLISEDMTTPFWRTVYESAKKEAEANDIYLEQIGSNLSEEYNLKDYLRIGITSKADGIIICPDGSAGVAGLINEADKAGIPVVTMLNDVSNTNRVSFVGINSYELGLVYGEQI